VSPGLFTETMFWYDGSVRDSVFAYSRIDVSLLIDIGEFARRTLESSCPSDGDGCVTKTLFANGPIAAP
jgi:hypothetical protein